MTALNLCRVTVQTQGKDGSVTADLALPNGIELAEVLPSVVDIVGGEADIIEVTGRWTVSRIDGSALDESKTLQENGVRDGDMLILANAETRIPVAFADNIFHTVAGASASRRDGGLSRRISAAACLWSAGFGAVALACSDHAPVSGRAVIAAIVAVAATAASIAAGRVEPEPLPALALGMTAAVFAAVAGFLSVPGGPAPPNFLLAAVACSAVSIALIHFAPPGATFTAIAGFATTVAITAAVVTVWPAPVAAVGAMLAAASLAMLGAAAKLSIVLSGLSPAMSGTSDAAPAGVLAALAERGHQTLTGLLTGFSASAALGAVLVAAGQREKGAVSGVGLTAVMAVALLLRARHQPGTPRFVAVLAAGMISATTTFVLVVFSAPYYTQWVCLTAVVFGVGVLWSTVASRPSQLSPVLRRGVELSEYLALGLVVPMACWVGNVFGIVRGLSLQ